MAASRADRCGGSVWQRRIWVLAMVGLIELALFSTSSPGWPTLARGFQRAFDAMPWTGDPTFRRGDGRARVGPAPDPRIPAGSTGSRSCRKTATAGPLPVSAEDLRGRARETAALLAVLWVIARLCAKGRLSLASHALAAGRCSRSSTSGCWGATVCSTSGRSSRSCRAEPGPGQTRPGTARDADRRRSDSRTCPCWSGWHRSLPIALSICRPYPS